VTSTHEAAGAPLETDDVVSLVDVPRTDAAVLRSGGETARPYTLIYVTARSASNEGKLVSKRRESSTSTWDSRSQRQRRYSHEDAEHRSKLPVPYHHPVDVASRQTRRFGAAERPPGLTPSYWSMCHRSDHEQRSGNSRQQVPRARGHLSAIPS
jgi:hypothetical protein